MVVTGPPMMQRLSHSIQSANPDGERRCATFRQALAGGHLSGDGPFTARCHRVLEALVGVPKALLTTSCTHALEMAAFLLDVKPGDEVIVPSFTFVSSVNAFVVRGRSSGVRGHAAGHALHRRTARRRA